jgi:hypothetical protein
MRRPIASSPPNSSRAPVWLTSAASWGFGTPAARRSCRVNSRPRSSGTPSVAKYAAPIRCRTTLACTSPSGFGAENRAVGIAVMSANGAASASVMALTEPFRAKRSGSISSSRADCSAV